MRTIKETLKRKNAQRVLELANAGKTVTEIANEIGIWYNVANFLFKELKKEGFIKQTNGFEALLTSKRKEVIINAFNKSKTVFQNHLVKEIGASKLPADMLEDLRKLEAAGFITVQIQGSKKVLIMK